MPGTFFGPYNEQYATYVEPAGGNTGRWPLGHRLTLPDGRTYDFALNDGTVEVAGNLYQSVAREANHLNLTPDVARAIDAVVMSATLGATLAAIDIYSEGIIHVNVTPGVGYAYRIRRARANGDAHAAVASSGIITVNLESGEKVQVATTTTSRFSLTRNRYHQILITAAPPTGGLAGVSPGVAAADRYYWSQCQGFAAVLADGTLLEGLPVQASIAVAGSVESVKRRVRTGGTVTVLSPTVGVGQLTDVAGAVVSGMLSDISTSVATTVDITGGIAVNAPLVGICYKPATDTNYGLIDLKYLA